MDALKLKRTGIRSSFTKTANVLKAEIVKDDLNIGMIKDKFTKLQNVQDELKYLDEKYLDLLIEGAATEEAVKLEIESRELYSDEFITLSRQFNEKIESLDNPGFETRSHYSGSIMDNKTRSYKLPKIELKKFDGELVNWLPFWSQFDKIHKDPDLHESDKFAYLVQSMESKSRAEEFIQSYPITSENYEKAVSALKDRFGKPELLIEVYVRELIKLIISNVKADSRNKLPLDKLFDKIEAQLRALESLGLKASENSSWLYPMVESSLTEEVLKAWQRSLFFSQQEGAKLSRLDNLMKFLKSEVEGEERLKLAREGFDSSDSRRQCSDRVRGEFRRRFKKTANVPTAVGFLATRERCCLFCDKHHDSANCYNARSLSFEEKISRVKDKRCCLKCLEPNHIAKFCKRFIRCYVCGKAHLILLCPEIHNKVVTERDKQVTENVHVAIAGQTCTTEVTLMTLQVKVVGVNKTRNVRVLLDCGSQKSYILESLAVELGLPVVSRETIAHTLFGGHRTDPKLHNKYRVKMCSTKRGSYQNLEFEFLDQKVICGDIPRLAKGPILRELKCNNIWLSDMGSDCPKIEMLIGSDIYGKILTGKIRQLKGGLTAICTKLGWTICGKCDDFSSFKDENTLTLCTSLAVKELKLSDLWSLETIGILDAQENLKKDSEGEFVREQFLSSLKRKSDGRYCVSLPWMGGTTELPSNRHVAERRLFGVTRKLKSLNKYEEYDKIFREWIDEGVTEVVPEEELSKNGHYLPHHPVFKPESATTKIRPVFDASCKVGRSPSLNECLFKGPNLIEEIPSILLRFREKCIGVTSDIRRAFLQIELNRSDRDFLRFLWWEKENVIKVYRHTRVVFGVTSSPYLLGAVINFHLSQAPLEQKCIAQKLIESFYIDNCVTSVKNEQELEEFIRCSTEILAAAKMDLRMWTYGPLEKAINLVQTKLNSEAAIEDPVTVLGIMWNRKDDVLSIGIPTVGISENLCKRKILSLTQTVFDPLGLLAPVLLPAKLLLQEIWTIKVDWDAPLPESVKIRFLKWYNELKILTGLEIPRRIGFGDKSSWSLHIFCDASQHAYAAAIFLRCESNDEIIVNLVAAKSRITPLKRMTIPRLELMACVLGVRLCKYVTKALSLEENSKYFWTDSTTALAWIKRNDAWGTFVGNRVKEICSVTCVDQWSFVPGHVNPGDLPSRGCSSLQFIKLRWWEGPMWLKDSRDNWPKLDVKPDENLIISERSKVVKVNVNVNIDTVKVKWYEKFSEFSKILRILSWIKRFLSNCQGKSVIKEPLLTALELENAKTTLFLLVQAECFPGAGDSIHGILTVQDQNGLKRVKTKIIERSDTYNFRYPVLLPAKHHIVECLVREFHLKNSHAGVQALVTMIREDVWIINARRSVRSTIGKCVRCKRFATKPFTTTPIQLPLDRVRDASIFEICGIDLCGPLILRDKSKVWVLLFTCAVYRGVHLELVTSISTECFIAALRRFIARRGRPSIIYSDNGTNFVGTSSLLRKVDWKKVVSEEILNPIVWKFIPPTGAWWGGWWERLIRTTKSLLLKVLGRASVDYEELLTIIADVEAVINERPLTYVSNDAEDLLPLTPSMFLRDIRQSGTADLDLMDKSKLLIRQKYCQELREQLRGRFRQEYLGQLIQKTGQKACELKIGDVVLVGSENFKRIHWPIARVQELCVGRDGRVRVAKVKTKTGILIRPVRKLYPLEVSERFAPP